jgi:hypothetical protein
MDVGGHHQMSKVLMTISDRFKSFTSRRQEHRFAMAALDNKSGVVPHELC